MTLGPKNLNFPGCIPETKLVYFISGIILASFWVKGIQQWSVTLLSFGPFVSLPWLLPDWPWSFQDWRSTLLSLGPAFGNGPKVGRLEFNQGKPAAIRWPKPRDPCSGAKKNRVCFIGFLWSTLPKTNSKRRTPLEINGWWKTILSFRGPAYFQGIC